MATALVEFYLKGDVAKLKAILGEGNVDNEPAQLEIEEETDKIMLDDELNDGSNTNGNYFDSNDAKISNDVLVSDITDVKIVNTQTTTEEFSEDTSKVTQPIEKNIQSRNLSNGYNDYKMQ